MIDSEKLPNNPQSPLGPSLGSRGQTHFDNNELDSTTSLLIFNLVVQISFLKFLFLVSRIIHTCKRTARLNHPAGCDSVTTAVILQTHPVGIALLFHVIYVMFYIACIYCKLPGSGRSDARGMHKHGAEDSAGRPGPRVPKAQPPQRPELSQARPNRPARRGIAAPPRPPRSHELLC